MVVNEDQDPVLQKVFRQGPGVCVMAESCIIVKRYDGMYSIPNRC